MRRIGILGGTFDPIHCGHLDAGEAAQRTLGLTEMLVLTASTPPHRTANASVYHRFAMVALAVLDRKGWIASDLELGTATPSYTTDTLKRLHRCGYAPLELFFVIGADAFAEIESWRDYPAILDQAHFAVVSRAGLTTEDLRNRLPRLAGRFRHPDTTEAGSHTGVFLINARTADVSSTAIRERRASRQSIAGLVPPAVGQHIERHGLYLDDDPHGRRRTGVNTAAAGRLHGQE